jgi:hypothetical protein
VQLPSVGRSVRLQQKTTVDTVCKKKQLYEDKIKKIGEAETEEEEKVEPRLYIMRTKYAAYHFYGTTTVSCMWCLL